MNSHAKRNWAQYNQNLVNRGSLTFWFDEECLKSWVKQPRRKGQTFLFSHCYSAWMVTNNYLSITLKGFARIFAVYPQNARNTDYVT